MTGRWAGPVPAKCDVCGTPINSTFFDAKTFNGPWALMCPSCFHLGPGTGKLGEGFGQRYDKQADGSWLNLEKARRP